MLLAAELSVCNQCYEHEACAGLQCAASWSIVLFGPSVEGSVAYIGGLQQGQGPEEAVLCITPTADMYCLHIFCGLDCFSVIAAS